MYLARYMTDSDAGTPTSLSVMDLARYMTDMVNDYMHMHTHLKIPVWVRRRFYKLQVHFESLFG